LERFYYTVKTLELDTTKSSILMISCAVCYVFLPFNHTFKIIWTMQHDKIIIQEAQTVMQYFLSYVILLISPVTRTVLSLLSISWTFLLLFQCFYIYAPNNTWTYQTRHQQHFLKMCVNSSTAVCSIVYALPALLILTGPGG